MMLFGNPLLRQEPQLSVTCHLKGQKDKKRGSQPNSDNTHSNERNTEQL